MKAVNSQLSEESVAKVQSVQSTSGVLRQAQRLLPNMAANYAHSSHTHIDLTVQVCC